jgi:DNA-binding MarR family transcriptional regulator
MNGPTIDRLPEALANHAGYLLVRLGKQVARAFSACVEPLGLRPPHCDILLTLAERGSLSQVEIADTLEIEPAHLVTLLDQLAALGLIQRTADPKDRRRHAIVPTQRGASATAQVAMLASSVEDALFVGLTDAERTSCRALLRRLARAAAAGGGLGDHTPG